MNEEITEFDDLVALGALSKDIKIGAHTITMKTLNYDTYSGMIAGIDQGKSAMDTQLFVLSNSITKIDGKDVSTETKMRLLKSAQIGLVNLLTNEYEKMLSEQGEIYEDVKKNTSQASVKTP